MDIMVLNKELLGCHPSNAITFALDLRVEVVLVNSFLKASLVTGATNNRSAGFCV